jgi:hypothetical protein
MLAYYCTFFFPAANFVKHPCLVRDSMVANHKTVGTCELCVKRLAQGLVGRIEGLGCSRSRVYCIAKTVRLVAVLEIF